MSLKDASDCTRFFHTRILLLRPVLLVLMRTESGRVEDDQTMFRTALLREMSLRMSEACIITAHEMIEFLHQRLDTVYRSACWYMVYCKMCPYRFCCCFPSSSRSGWLTRGNSHFHVGNRPDCRKAVSFLACDERVVTVSGILDQMPGHFGVS